MNLKQQVEYILQTYPNTRNSDIKLTLNVWIKYYPSKVKFVKDKWFVALNDLYELPREDNVKRIRAKFNQQNLYLPTDPEVIKQRRQKEMEWKQQMLMP